MQDGLAGDVLIPDWSDWGILSLAVKDTLFEVPKGDGESISFRPVHDPMDDNYYHSEIRAFNQDQGDLLEDIKSKPARTAFRHKISGLVKVITPPRV